MAISEVANSNQLSAISKEMSIKELTAIIPSSSYIGITKGIIGIMEANS